MLALGEMRQTLNQSFRQEPVDQERAAPSTITPIK